MEDTMGNLNSKTNSVFTLGPLIKDEASPALQWASQYDKKAIRAKYLGDSLAGTGSRELLSLPSNGLGIVRSASTLSVVSKDKDLPLPPSQNASQPAIADRTHSDPATPAAVSVDMLPLVVEPAPIPVEPTEPVEVRVASEAAEVPLPPATPEIVETRVPKHQPAKLRKSTDAQRTSPDQKKHRGKVSAGPPPVQHKTGIRRLFGTKRSKSRESRTPQPEKAPEEEDPAVAAARRALEGEPALPGDGPVSPPLSPEHFARLATAKAPQNVIQTLNEAPDTSSMSAPVETAMSPDLPAELGTDVREGGVPPRTRRADEYDQLSRVDTNEKEHADREFSTFDQGPLLDQPAFVPDTPPRSAFLTPSEEPRHGPISLHSSQSIPLAESSADEEEDTTLTKQTSPIDRWAQIRKNAAERAAKQADEPPTTRSRTETRTDDGETSGEESKLLLHILS